MGQTLKCGRQQGFTALTNWEITSSKHQQENSIEAKEC